MQKSAVRITPSASSAPGTPTPIPILAPVPIPPPVSGVEVGGAVASEVDGEVAASRLAEPVLVAEVALRDVCDVCDVRADNRDDVEDACSVTVASGVEITMTCPIVAAIRVPLPAAQQAFC